MVQRYRVTRLDDLHGVNHVKAIHNATGTVVEGDYPWTALGGYSYITDNNNGHLRPANSYCEHFRVSSVVAPGLYVHIPHHTGDVTLSSVAPSWFEGTLTQLRNELKGDLTVPYELVEKARESWPQIAEHWSSLNTILDGLTPASIIGDFNRLRQLHRLGPAAQMVLWRTAFNHNYGSNLPDLARFCAENWLGFTFGFMPFLSDLGALRSNFLELDSRLNQLMNRSEDVQVSTGKWAKPLIFSMPSQTYTVHHDSVRGYRNVTVHPTFTGVEIWSLCTKYRFTVPPLDNPAFATRAMLDLLGLHPDISTVWDALPMSFIFDWLTPTDEVIDRITDPTWADIPMDFISTSLTCRKIGKLVLSYSIDGGASVSGTSSADVSFFYRFSDPDGAIGDAVHRDYVNVSMMTAANAVALAFRHRENTLRLVPNQLF